MEAVIEIQICMLLNEVHYRAWSFFINWFLYCAENYNE